MNRKKIYQDLMTGVSYFLPFVVGGGILIALAFIIDVQNASLESFGATTQISAWFLDVGGIAMGLMLPILAGYIAYSIADRPGLLVGIVSGTLAQNGGSGFLGAILAGFIAGYVIEFLKKLFKIYVILPITIALFSSVTLKGFIIQHQSPSNQQE